MINLTKYTSLNEGSNWKFAISRKKVLIVLCTICAIAALLNIKYLTSCAPKQDGFVATFKHSNTYYALRLRQQPYIVPPLKVDDYHKLIDLNDFEFLIKHEQECKDSYFFLLVLVSSAPKNHEMRYTIRATWGRRDIKVKLFFMLGAVTDPDLQNDIEQENAAFGDIVQGNFLDSYSNLTYKSIMALKYVTYYCNNVTYILKTDDDIFVNMPLMKNYLTNDLSPFGAENFLQCQVMKHILIRRKKSMKWAVTEKEFPGTEYPTYCTGPYAIMSPDVLYKLYRGAQRSKFFWIEDVFLYGVSAGKYPEIHHTDTRMFSLWNYSDYKISNGIFDRINFLFGPFEMTMEQMLEFWDFVKHRPVPSSIYYYV